MSILEVISTEASQAVSCSLVKSVAIGAHSHTEAFSIEPASCRALNTCLSGPGLAEEVALRNNRSIDVDDTSSFLNDGSIVASEAGSSGSVPGGAEIADLDTDFLSVGVPSLGALGTDTIGPDGASDVGGSVDIGLFALAIDDLISLVALFTDAFLEVELLAFSLDFAADSVLIEIVVLGALDAGVIIPDPAAKVVIKLYEESRIVELLFGQGQLLS